MAEEIYEMLDEYFQENVEKIQNSNKNLNNEQLLELYGLYKQSIIGNNNTNDEVYRRELRQFEASLHNNSKIERSKIRLQRLKFVETVEVEKNRVSVSNRKI